MVATLSVQDNLHPGAMDLILRVASSGVIAFMKSSFTHPPLRGAMLYLNEANAATANIS